MNTFFVSVERLLDSTLNGKPVVGGGHRGVVFARLPTSLLKITFSNFDTESKQNKICYTASDKSFIRYRKEIFDQLYTSRMMLRLIGMRLSGLVQGNYQINLFDDTEDYI